MDTIQLSEFITNHWELSFAFAVLLGMLILGEIQHKTRGFPDISPQQLIQLTNEQDITLLDVRNTDELKNGTLPDNIHIPLQELNTRHSELNPDKTVIIYCRSGHRSAKACSLLKKLGFNDLRNLNGGLMAWQSANLPINKA